MGTNWRDVTPRNESEQMFLDLAEELGVTRVYRDVGTDRLSFSLHYIVTSDDLERCKPQAGAFADAMKRLMGLEPVQE